MPELSPKHQIAFRCWL